ncbi:MAG: hypothetical protein EBR82_31120 [Caulobacteraceae bacterium]|nr:hypothetical protein [Caulobacteraceae bacterium]
MTTYTDLLTEVSKLVALDGTNVINSATSVTLGLTYRRIQEVTFTAPSQQLIMPSPTIRDQGDDCLVINKGAQSFDIYSGGVLATVATSEAYYVRVTYAGAWEALKLAPVTSSLVSGLAGFGLTASGTQLRTNATPLAGNGLVGTGTNPIDVNPDNTTMIVSSDQLKVGTISNTNFATSTITADKLAFGIGTIYKYTGSNGALPQFGTLVISTPATVSSGQYDRFVKIYERVGGEARQQNAASYSVDLGREDQVTITKLSAGAGDVRAIVWAST